MTINIKLLLKLGSIARSDQDLVAVFGWETGIDARSDRDPVAVFGWETGIDSPFRDLNFYPPLSVQCTIQNNIISLACASTGSFNRPKAYIGGKKIGNF